MKTVLKADLYRMEGLKGFSGFYEGLKSPGFRFIYILRNLKNCTKYLPKWFLFKILYRKYTYKYGFQIPIETKIGKGLYIGHFGTIIINKDVVIGKNCNLSPNVIIGQVNRGKLVGSPSIGDSVWIGTGAIIVGKITIGTNVLIAPNAFVNFNVPDNSIVIGNPAKIVSNELATEGYINFTI
jgi:serine O-acetyltransferase